MFNCINRLTLCLQGVGLTLFFSCSQPAVKQKADIIFYGGPIITMEGGKDSLVEAVGVKDGKILFVGMLEESEDYKDKRTVLRDLKGKTLLPGFIDTHSHLTAVADLEGAVDLSPALPGKVNSIKNIQQVLRTYIRTDSISAGTPVIGHGYDDAMMSEHRHPTRDELDAVSSKHPIMVLHASGSMSVVNSAMLALLGINEKTKDTEGGYYDYARNSLGDRLNGRLDGNATFHALATLMAKLPTGDHPKDVLKKKIERLVNAQELWIRNGQTTVCDGRTMNGSMELLKTVASEGLFQVDVIYFPDFESVRNEIGSMKADYMKYRDRLKLGGFKFSSDGSTQGKAAWLTAPYLVPPAGESSTYRGRSIYPDSVLYEDLKCLFLQKVTAQLHVNGDAAIDQALRVVEQLSREGVYTEDIRATLIQGQNSRPDHMSKIKALGLIPSYFPAYVHLWGDWSVNNVFGSARAAFLSPTQAAKNAGIPFTIHHDSPVTPPNLLTAVYAAVNRTTRSGVVLGADQRISVMDALRAITINAAYQYHEEHDKGSIAKGKLADLVILDSNPLAMDPKDLRNIKVAETIKEGITLYVAK
ncbi:amidohydrolase [Sphingobacterium psychroaquaticum]|uniref:Amidohydrolase 3 domain-containing protein n=1 Tax=Sphingobacterium psychroaquaticum TaxID=561061 RepID=A0A1X7I947_9SPHI|nr:amidohydrolase [Sphingobacterium psychroaquaticum]SMG10521.1 hypothetical protein SAMN05660862_0540 [Sphingobacterium psychroaquaticum]